MLTNVRVQNFKAFQELDLPLKPITLLLGPNNAGKSSILAPIRLLAQTANTGDRAISLLLDGPFGDFGTYRDLVYGHHRGRPLTIALSVDGPEWGYEIAAEFKYWTERRLLLARDLRVAAEPNHQEDEDSTPEKIQLARFAYDDKIEQHVLTKLRSHVVPKSRRQELASFVRVSHFVPILYFGQWRFMQARQRRSDQEAAETPPPWLGLFDDDVASETEDLLDDANLSFTETLRAVDYISAMRLPPERTYHQTGETRTNIGIAGEHWTGMLVLDSARPGAASEGIDKYVGRWLADAGLAADLRLKWLSDRHYEVELQHPISREYANLADVGQANSQILPVLVGGYRLQPGSTFIVEEPEIHLHPSAQHHLANFFAELHEREVASLIETHSEYLVLGLQQLVASGRLNPDNLAFYYVYADEETSSKSVIPIQLDERGAFDMEALPKGFFPERLEQARALARLRAER